MTLSVHGMRSSGLQRGWRLCLLQAWADAQAAAGEEAISEDQKWEVAASLLAKMGDPETAAR